MDTATMEPGDIEEGVFPFSMCIYTGLLGQIGDIIMFSAILRRLRQLFPVAAITCAVSSRYREAGELVAGLPYANRLFVIQLYFEKLTPLLAPWLPMPGWSRPREAGCRQVQKTGLSTLSSKRVP